MGTFWIKDGPHDEFCFGSTGSKMFKYFRCEAENEYGSAWTEGPIIFMAEGAPRPDEGAPDFMMPIKPVVVMVGETATFEGKVVANPKPSIKW